MLRLTHNKGQAIFEYAVILAIVALALGMMQVYLRRGIQAGIKIAADELGQQEGSVELDPTKGTTQTSLMSNRSSATRQIQYGQSGSRAVSAQESSQASGETEYWGNWEED